MYSNKSDERINSFENYNQSPELIGMASSITDGFEDDERLSEFTETENFKPDGFGREDLLTAAPGRPGTRPSPGTRPPGDRPPNSGNKPPSSGHRPPDGRPPNPGHRPPDNRPPRSRPPMPSNRPPNPGLGFPPGPRPGFPIIPGHIPGRAPVFRPPGINPQRGMEQRVISPIILSRCQGNLAYLWLRNGESGWLFMDNVYGMTVTGYTWTKMGWMYTAVDIGFIGGFYCYG